MRRLVALICIFALAGTLAGCSKNNTKSNASTSGSSGVAVAQQVGSATAAAGGNAGAGSAATRTGSAYPVTKVVEAVRPSVVKVEAAGQVQQSGPFGLGRQTAQAQGTGTGMLLDTQGHILTNNHVVTLESSNVAQSLKVNLANGKTVDAKVVGRDPQTDLAVVQVSQSDLSGTKPITWAEPKSIVVGEPVVAIGYALDLGGEPTVTTGVVSATDRIIDEQNGVTISGSVQTDAAINPGNSGGPLIDLTGKVIGVNTAGLTGSAQQPAQGLNFAISVGTAQSIAQDLISKGQVTRGYMGVGLVNITPQLAQGNSLPVDHGAGVQQVSPGSPAQQAGLQAGDIIVKINSVSINNTGDLTNALTKYGPGTKVTVGYYRGNQQRTADLTLGQRPSGG